MKPIKPSKQMKGKKEGKHQFKLWDKWQTEFSCKLSQEGIESFCGLLSTSFGFDLYRDTDHQGLDSEVPADLRAIINLINASEVDQERMGIFIPFSFIANK